MKLYSMIFILGLLSPATVFASISFNDASLSASAYVLVDANSGEVLAEKQSDEALSPASITKVMLAYVVFDALSNQQVALDDQVTISEDVWRKVYGKGGSIMFLEPRDKVTVEQLLKGLIVQSGNDAALALAEYLSGSEEAMVDRMNETARALGMDRSQFKNVTGLTEEGHYMSPSDMVILTQSLVKRFPDYYRLFKEREYTYNSITQRNRNALLWEDESVDGVKTGHTKEAGYCLLSSAQRDEMRLIAVVMDSDGYQSRYKDSKRLLDFGFGRYETHKLYSNEQVLINADIKKGELDKVALGLNEDLYITVPRGQYDQLKATMDVSLNKEAPIQQGDAFGSVKITLNGELVKEVPLIAQQSVPLGNWLKQIIDSFF